MIRKSCTASNQQADVQLWCACNCFQHKCLGVVMGSSPSLSPLWNLQCSPKMWLKLRVSQYHCCERAVKTANAPEVCLVALQRRPLCKFNTHPASKNTHQSRAFRFEFIQNQSPLADPIFLEPVARSRTFLMK